MLAACLSIASSSEASLVHRPAVLQLGQRRSSAWPARFPSGSGSPGGAATAGGRAFPGGRRVLPGLLRFGDAAAISASRRSASVRSPGEFVHRRARRRRRSCRTAVQLAGVDLPAGPERERVVVELLAQLAQAVFGLGERSSGPARSARGDRPRNPQVESWQLALGRLDLEVICLIPSEISFHTFSAAVSTAATSENEPPHFPTVACRVTWVWPARGQLALAERRHRPGQPDRRPGEQADRFAHFPAAWIRPGWLRIPPARSITAE